MSKMLAPVFKGEGRIVYEMCPIPVVVDPTDVIVSIDACGICGADLNILATPPAHKARTDIIIGHEGTGSVKDVGRDVTDLQPGDKVVIAPRLTCGRCVYCRAGLDNQCLNYDTIGTTVDGAFVPYLRAPKSVLYRISDEVSRDDATLFEPLSCVVGALARIPFQPGNNVVINSSGPMGLLFAQTLRTLGAGKIIMTDLVPYMLRFAETLDVDAALNPNNEDVAAQVQKMTGIGADLVIDAVGNQINTAINLARRGGISFSSDYGPTTCNPSNNTPSPQRPDFTWRVCRSQTLHPDHQTAREPSPATCSIDLTPAAFVRTSGRS